MQHSSPSVDETISDHNRIFVDMVVNDYRTMTQRRYPLVLETPSDIPTYDEIAAFAMMDPEHNQFPQQLGEEDVRMWYVHPIYASKRKLLTKLLLAKLFRAGFEGAQRHVHIRLLVNVINPPTEDHTDFAYPKDAERTGARNAHSSPSARIPSAADVGRSMDIYLPKGKRR